MISTTICFTGKSLSGLKNNYFKDCNNQGKWKTPVNKSIAKIVRLSKTIHIAFITSMGKRTCILEIYLFLQPANLGALPQLISFKVR